MRIPSSDVSQKICLSQHYENGSALSSLKLAPRKSSSLHSAEACRSLFSLAFPIGCCRAQAPRPLSPPWVPVPCCSLPCRTDSFRSPGPSSQDIPSQQPSAWRAHIAFLSPQLLRPARSALPLAPCTSSSAFTPRVARRPLPQSWVAMLFSILAFGLFSPPCSPTPA